MRSTTDRSGAGSAPTSHFKVVCVSPDLKDSVDEMAKSQRDIVVMVRVDEKTRDKLDAWVEAVR